MSYYAFIYISSIFFSVLGGALVFNRYKNISGLFFLLFTIFTSLWFLFYFLFFSGIQDPALLLLFSRSAFGISILSLYSFFFFIKFFQASKGKSFTPSLIPIFVFYAIILFVYLGTDSVVSGLAYSLEENVYRETYGSLYLGHVAISILFIPLVIIYSYKQLKKQTYLNRIRLKRILLAAFLMLLSLLVLQLILPAFGIWILEKEIIFLFVGFVLSTVFTVRRYYFSSIGYGLGKVFSIIFSIILAIIALNSFKYVYTYLGNNNLSYWSTHDAFSIVDTILGIGLFTSIYIYIKKKFLGNSAQVELKSAMRKLEQRMSYITNLPDLNKYLEVEIKKTFKTNFCKIFIFEADNKNELQKYFESDLTDYIFINDIVFIEERLKKSNRELLLQEIPESTFLVLPLFDTDKKNIGIFVLGVKLFGDFYNIDEIDTLKELVVFLESHIKYIQTYEKLEDLSINLDKKVDEKTMEYNNLINKQKEFISVISHEIKSPIATAIFQADSIMDDFENGVLGNEEIRKELEVLNNQLVKTSDLLAKLFSVQYYDTHGVSLFKEKVQISHLLQTELDVYSRMNQNINFVNEIDPKMGFAELDKIQFQQVIANILNNAVKFLDKKDSTIMVRANKKHGVLTVIIEDNGKGFQGIDISRLFDRYSTGIGASTGLGMGLYLCKKIIDMHNGDIVASTGEQLGGAKFTISIPV